MRSILDQAFASYKAEEMNQIWDANMKLKDLNQI